MDAELFKPFKLCISIFKTAGMWQDGNQTWAYFILGYLFHFTFLEVYTLLVAIYAFKAENLVDFVDAFCLTIALLAQIFKSVNFFYKLKLIIKQIETLDSILVFSADKRFERREKVRAQVAKAFLVFKVLLTTAAMTCLSAIFVPFMAHKLPYKIWLPFDTDYGTFGFWFSASLLIVNSYFIASTDMTLDILPVVFSSFIIGVIEELSSRLNDIGKLNESNENDVNELIKCIEIQKKIKEFVNDTRSNFSTAILGQALMSSIILCTSAFLMSTVGISLSIKSL